MISPRALIALSAGLSLASAAAASAQTVVQDRYGPPPAGSALQALQAQPAASAYGGRMLGWTGKRSPAPAETTHSAPARPEPMALARQFIPQAAAPAAPRPTTSVQPGYEPVLRAALQPAAGPAPDLLGGPPSAPLPTSIYGPAAAPPQAPPPPQTYAQATPVPRPGGSQLYSLHREYGLTPDAIPAPPAGDNFILVGPPDAPASQGDGDEPAQGLDRQF